MSERLELARTLAAVGYASAQTWWPGGAATESLGASSKGDPLDLVTAADVAIEADWRARIGAAFPEDAIVGEEEGGHAGAHGWWLDPIDGTVNFARGWPLWACAVATADEHERVGAISLGTGVHLWGSTATGAYCDRGRGGVRARVTDVRRPGAAVVLSFIGWDHAHGDRQPARYDRLSRVVRHLQQIWSMSTVFAGVASGQADGAVVLVPADDRERHPWDFLPGIHLCEAAGATVVHTPHAVVVAGPALVEALVDAAGG